VERYLKESLQISDNVDARFISSLTLAYVGDAVFELFVRNRIVKENPRLSVDKLHQLAVNYVNASSQSSIVHRVWDCLNEEEKWMVKKGRNAKSGSSPKNADVVDYRYATGYETLIGYLFLKDDIQRLMEILNMSYEKGG